MTSLSFEVCLELLNQMDLHDSSSPRLTVEGLCCFPCWPPLNAAVGGSGGVSKPGILPGTGKMCLGVSSLPSVELFPKPSMFLPSFVVLQQPMGHCQSWIYLGLTMWGLLSECTFQHHKKKKKRGKEERNSFKYVLGSFKNNKSRNKIMTKETKLKKVPERGFGRNFCRVEKLGRQH